MYKIINEKTLLIGTKQFIFPCSISGIRRNHPSIVEIDKLIVVNFYPFTEEEDEALKDIDMERNIWAFNSDGDLVWTIAYPSAKIEGHNPYTSVYIKNGRLIAGNWAGIDYLVNTKNGSVDVISGKRPW